MYNSNEKLQHFQHSPHLSSQWIYHIVRETIILISNMTEWNHPKCNVLGMDFCSHCYISMRFIHAPECSSSWLFVYLFIYLLYNIISYGYTTLYSSIFLFWLFGMFPIFEASAIVIYERNTRLCWILPIIW